MRRRAAVALAGSLALAGLAVACATSGGDAQTHGPVFDLDGSATLGDAALGSDAPLSLDVYVPDDAQSSHEDGSSAELTDASDEDLDAGPAQDATDAATNTADCGAETVLLAGGGSSLFGAVAVGNGPFTVDTLTGSAALTPALVPTTAGFEALVAMSGDAGGGYALFGLGLGASGATWSTPSALGAAASAIDAPALALLGSNVEAAYLDPAHLYFHAEWAGTSWNAGTDPVTPAGGTQSFGPVRASAAATASELVIAYEGNNQDLYAQSWTPSGGWQAAVQIGTSTLATNTPPAIVALTAGGADDLLVVYDAPANPPSEQHILYALRTAATKAWSTPVQIDPTIYSPYAPSLAAMTGGRALLGWRGGNSLAYTSEYDPTPTPGWKTAVPIGSSTVTVPPSLAAGTCSTDAVAALVVGGAVSVAAYASGAWQASSSLPGITGAQVAAIATR